MSAQGTTTIDFGAAPGTNVITKTITGQTGITSSMYVEAFIMNTASADHNAYEHMIVPLQLRCGNIVEGVGFDIVAVCFVQLTGTWNVYWVYN